MSDPGQTFAGTHVAGFEVPIHGSLGSPILLGGAPRGIAIVNGTIAAAVGLGLQQWLGGLVLWAMGHTLLGVGSELALAGQGDLVQAIRMSTQDGSSRASDQITSRNLQVQPTITIRPGAPVRLVVNRDLILAPWKE